LQGFGNVGSAALLIWQKWAKVIGIIDRDGGLINEDGFHLMKLKPYFLNKDGNKLVADNMIILTKSTKNMDYWC
jgi:glutamate dehydrogenase/leucine dehydrogenase